MNKPVIWDPHDYFYDGFEGGPLRWSFVKRCMERILVWRRVPCLVVSQGMREIYKQMYPGITTHLIKNFSLIRPEFKACCPLLSNDIGASQKSGPVVRLIYPGQILSSRLPPEFIEAVSRDESLRLDIYGLDRWGVYLEEIKLKIDSGQIGNIHFLGSYSPSDLPAILAKYDYAILPYEVMGRNIDFCLPNKFFQCLAAGLPIIVSNLQELGTIVEVHGLGLVFKAGNYQEAIELIKKWPSHSPEYAVLRRRVKEYALTQMDYQAEAIVLLGIYAMLMAP